MDSPEIVIETRLSADGRCLDPVPPTRETWLSLQKGQQVAITLDASQLVGGSANPTLLGDGLEFLPAAVQLKLISTTPVDQAQWRLLYEYC